MRSNKYNAKKKTVDGITFDSTKEALRYQDLRKMASIGEITHLELQPRFELQEAFRYHGKAVRKIEYVADFRYRDRDGNDVVEDVKGVKTEGYKLKRKLFLFRYGDSIDFREI